MSFQDFVNNFEKLEICHLGPQSVGESLLVSHNKRTWESSNHHGIWKKGSCAGGCLNFQGWTYLWIGHFMSTCFVNSETFWSNPQFQIEVTDPDKDDADNTGTVIIGLLQKNTRSVKNHNGLFAIGYVIYKVGRCLLIWGCCLDHITFQLPHTECGLLDKAFFRTNRKVAMSPAFINMREVCGRHRLSPGTYAIVPSTFEANQEADFLLRIFSERTSSGKFVWYTLWVFSDKCLFRELDVASHMIDKVWRFLAKEVYDLWMTGRSESGVTYACQCKRDEWVKGCIQSNRRGRYGGRC